MQFSLGASNRSFECAVCVVNETRLLVLGSNKSGGVHCEYSLSLSKRLSYMNEGQTLVN